jgi:hypothetical protein
MIAPPRLQPLVFFLILHKAGKQWYCFPTSWVFYAIEIIPFFKKKKNGFEILLDKYRVI